MRYFYDEMGITAVLLRLLDHKALNSRWSLFCTAFEFIKAVSI